ncbi:OmpA family protein [Aestuariibius sp. 2305UL40-4]|uniref:OmpA family protein n=1 Tax=Aestuariibius violaceus TaxID=3234132 RepID=UPI00345EF60B
MTRFITVVLAAFLTGPGAAQTLDLPATATLQVEEVEPATTYSMPIGPWAETGVAVEERTGTVNRRVWRIGGGLTTAQLIAPIRQQLEADNWDILFACETEGCGGFDFRFGIDVIGAPRMQVDLGDFRFLSAERPEDAAALLVLVSRTSSAGFVQMISVAGGLDLPLTAVVKEDETPRESATAEPSPPPRPIIAAPTTTTGLSGNIARDLGTVGRAILGDLNFATGSSDLGPGPFASLDALVASLRTDPALRIALVGHTDAEGSLEANIALSRARARSVLQRLVDSYGIDRTRLEGEGMGYLAPIGNNRTEEGRAANRRVEAIVISTE